MFLVMRTHTIGHAVPRVKWQVESRPIKDRRTAEGLCEHLQESYLEQHPRGRHKFFVIETDFPHLTP